MPDLARMALLVSFGVLASCRSPSASGVDCSLYERLVKEGPGQVKLSPEELEPARFWQGYETCHAKPGATACDKAWLLLTSMPSMASPSPEELEKQRRDHHAACETLPPAERLCLTAYVFAHQAECDRLGAKVHLDEARERLGRGQTASP